MLLSAVPRVTLMLYELSSPGDGQSVDQKAAKLETTSQKFLAMAYDGLLDRNLAKMVIALRTPDYGDLLPQMLKKLDDANRANPYYLGWARHSYNDFLNAPSPSARARRIALPTSSPGPGTQSCCLLVLKVTQN
jgi:hypothetical protein